MLKDQDRIFQNLYNDLGSDLISCQKRGDWIKTKEIIAKGREWIIEEIKNSEVSKKTAPLSVNSQIKSATAISPV